MMNGAFHAKFDPIISGTADLLKRKGIEKTEFLWDSIRKRQGNIYSPSTEHFTGYAQYPRPISKLLQKRVKSKRSVSTASNPRKLKSRLNNYLK